MRLLFQGDSITDGNRLKNPADFWDKNHTMGHSFAYITAAALGFSLPEIKFEFVNRGISGNTSADIYSRREADIFAERPDLMVLLCGVNDALKHFGGDEGDFSPLSYEKVLTSLLDECAVRLPDMKVIMLEPFAFKPDLSELIPLYQQAAYASAKNRCHFIPLQIEFNRLCKYQQKEYWLWDGVHPTEAGHGMIASRLIRTIRDLCFSE